MARVFHPGLLVGVFPQRDRATAPRTGSLLARGYRIRHRASLAIRHSDCFYLRASGIPEHSDQPGPPRWRPHRFCLLLERACGSRSDFDGKAPAGMGALRFPHLVGGVYAFRGAGPNRVLRDGVRHVASARRQSPRILARASLDCCVCCPLSHQRVVPDRSDREPCAGCRLLALGAKKPQGACAGSGRVVGIRRALDSIGPVTLPSLPLVPSCRRARVRLQRGHELGSQRPPCFAQP